MKELINSIRIFLIYRFYNLGVILERISNKGFALDIFSSSFQNNPYETYSTNIMGTVNFFEAVRATPSVKVDINITSDKELY